MPDQDRELTAEAQIDSFVSRLHTVFEASGDYTTAEVQYDPNRLILRGVGRPSPEIAALMNEAPANLAILLGRGALHE